MTREVELEAPEITPELIEWLVSIFPDRCPEPGTPQDVVWVASGAAKVVRFLRQTMEEQQETSLVDVQHP